MNKSAQISAVIITYNEEKYIAECIDSLNTVVDEIVIVDSNSTDATCEIAEAKGARIIHAVWQGYSANKNLGNEAATSDFILSIDADEALSDELKASILRAKSEGLDLRKVYSFNRKNFYCGQWIRFAGWYPDTKVRLFAKENTVWEGEVHEQLVYSNSVTQEHLRGDLLHESIVDKADHIARIKKYNKLASPYSSSKAYSSAIAQFLKLYVIKAGFLDGRLGFQLCLLSAKGKIWRQKKHL